MIRTVSQKNTIFVDEDFLKRLNASRPLGLHEEHGEIHILNATYKSSSDLYCWQKPKHNRFELPEDLCQKCCILPGQRLSIVFKGYPVPEIILRKL